MSGAPEDVIAGGVEPSAYRLLLKNRNFRRWFVASFVSSLGDWMGFVALPILVAGFFAAGSRPALFALGGVMMARLLPSVLFGPISGVLADRYDRKTLIVTTDLVRFGLFVAIAFSADLTAAVALTFVVECVSLLFMAARDASLPTIVAPSTLAQANQLNLLVAYGTLPVGAVAATAMIGLASMGGHMLGVEVEPIRALLLIDATTYLFSAAVMARVRFPKVQERRERGEGPGFIEDLREGLDFIRGYPIIRALITGVMGVFFGAGVVIALGPEYVRADLRRPESDWSILIAAVGIGLVLGIVALVPVVLRRFDKERTFPVVLAVTGSLAAATALMPSFVAVLPLGVLLGASAGVSIVLGYTLLHEHTEDATRARTFAAFYTTTRIALFVALGFGPFVAGAIGQFTIGVGGLDGAVSGIRVTILAGGLTAALSGLRARRSISAASARGDLRVRLTPTPAPPTDGVFIAFEGVEGSGKSTQIARLEEALVAEGYDVVRTREPGGSPIAERIRGLLLDPNAEGMDDRTEALLYAAARAEHMRQVIEPALAQGKVVLCDRFVDSSLAYQGYARGLGEDDVFEVNRWAIDGRMPDVVVLLRLDPEEGLRRVEERARRVRAEEERRRVDGSLFALRGLADQRVADRLEREGVAFHRKVDDGYLRLARRGGRPFLVVDASGDAEAIARQVRAGVHRWLPLPSEHRGDGAGGAEGGMEHEPRFAAGGAEHGGERPAR